MAWGDSIPCSYPNPFSTLQAYILAPLNTKVLAALVGMQGLH